MSDSVDAEVKAASGGRLKMIVGGLVLLAVGVGGGFGGAMALGMGGSADAAEGHGEEAAGHGEEAAGGHGEEAAGHGEEAAGGHGEPAAGGHGEPAAGGHGGGGGEAAPPKRGTSRTVVNLGTFTVNLRGSGGGRVLRTEVQVEVDGADEASVDEKKAMLRDAVISLASDFTFGDLEGIDGKTHLRDELLGRLNSVTSRKPEVGRVYFTEFVVQ